MYVCVHTADRPEENEGGKKWQLKFTHAPFWRFARRRTDTMGHFEYYYVSDAHEACVCVYAVIGVAVAKTIDNEKKRQQHEWNKERINET